jgi:hypothetical protein
MAEGERADTNLVAGQPTSTAPLGSVEQDRDREVAKEGLVTDQNVMTPEIHMVVCPHFDINSGMNVDLASALNGDALFSAEFDGARSELDGSTGGRYLQAGAAVLEF